MVSDNTYQGTVTDVMNNVMPTNLAVWMKQTNSSKMQINKVDRKRNRKLE